MEIPKSLQSSWNNIAKDGSINKQEFNKLVESASNDKKDVGFSEDEVLFLGVLKQELDKKGLNNNNNISIDKLSISKNSQVIPVINIPDNINVPDNLKETWKNVTTDGVLTVSDYQKIHQQALKSDSKDFLEVLGFINNISAKLSENKGVVFFVDNMALDDNSESVQVNNSAKETGAGIKTDKVADSNNSTEYNHGFNVVVSNKDRGAYYRKISSELSVDSRGINGVGVLPQVNFDPKRQYIDHKNPDSYKTGPLDRPSVYLGGNADGKEMDVGLTWDRVYTPHNGLPTYTDKSNGSDGRDPKHTFVKTFKNNTMVVLNGENKVIASGKKEVNKFMTQLKPNFAFRPVWRTNNNGGNQWNQPKVGAETNMYFYPGEKINMTVKDASPNHVNLSIELEGSKTKEKFNKTFIQEGFGLGLEQSFKRVNSIDQFMIDKKGNRVGLERKDVLPSNTTANGGGWLESSVLDKKGNKTPVTGNDFKEVRGGDTSSDYDKIFKRYNLNDKGGEIIDITPFKH